jgi:hypothetical protein
METWEQSARYREIFTQEPLLDTHDAEAPCDPPPLRVGPREVIGAWTRRAIAAARNVRWASWRKRMWTNRTAIVSVVAVCLLLAYATRLFSASPDTRDGDEARAARHSAARDALVYSGRRCVHAIELGLDVDMVVIAGVVYDGFFLSIYGQSFKVSYPSAMCAGHTETAEFSDMVGVANGRDPPITHYGPDAYCAQRMARIRSEKRC